MIGIKIGLRDIFMAPAAFGHDVQFEPGFIRATDRVRAMTITAHRQRLVCFSHLEEMDALFKLFFDAVMATAACRGDVPGVHAGAGIALGKHIVCCVAARAGCGNGEAALHQPFAMDAFRIVFDDLVLASGVPDGRPLAFAMAPGAESRNACRERRRQGIQFAFHIVSAVALFAGRAIGVICSDQFAMDARLELLTDLSMARCAVDLPGNGFTRPDMRRVDLRVTLTAGDFCVA